MPVTLIFSLPKLPAPNHSVPNEDNAMKDNSIKAVGVIVCRPSGSTATSFLTRKGMDVTIFDKGRRPSLIVDESLILDD